MYINSSLSLKVLALNIFFRIKNNLFFLFSQNNKPYILALFPLKSRFSELWGTSDMCITNLCPSLSVTRVSCPTGRLSLMLFEVVLSSNKTWMNCEGKSLKGRDKKRKFYYFLLQNPLPKKFFINSLWGKEIWATHVCPQKSFLV